MALVTRRTWPLIQTLIGHVLHADAGHHLEQLARDVLRGAVTPGRHVDLARVRLGVGDKFGDRFHGNRRIDRHDIGHPVDVCGRHDIANEIVIDIVNKASH